MQHTGGRAPKVWVSLRGASAKEVSRDVLLETVAQERASRLLVKKTAASALLIQRVWRGRRAAASAANIVEADWDAAILNKQYADPSLSTEFISNQVLRPLLFLISQSSRFSAQRAQNARRLVTGFKLLLESMSSSDLSRNYCSLAIGSPEERAQWLYQVHRILELCGTVLANDGQEWSTTDRTVRILPGLAMRVMVALTDATMWKGFSQKNDQLKANALALNLLEWLAKGNGGLFPAIRSYILANYPAPKGDSEHEQPPDRDKFIVTASAVTMALRPLVALSAASQQGPQEDRKGLESLKASSARAAVMVAIHVLTIPFLVERLPGALVPALQHVSALAPCLRSFGVSISVLMKMANLASSYQVMVNGKHELMQFPLAMWALSNLVSLACGSSTAKRTEFVKGLVLEQYVQALCCLLNDLTPFFESKQENLKSRYSSEDSDDIEAFQFGLRAMNSSIATEDYQKFGTGFMFQLLHKTLKPLHQSWHLVLLLEACEGTSRKMEEKQLRTETSQNGKELPKTLLQLPDVAKLYSNLLLAFSLFSQNGGRYPILNILAFSQTLLPRLWEWLQCSLKLQLPASKSVNASQSKSSSQLSKSLSIPKDGNLGKPASGKWASALGLKMRLRNTGAEGSSSSDTTQTAREGDSDEDRSQLWDLESMRSGPGGVPADAVPVLSLFCASYAHLLMVVDDEEFYERQVPFTMDQQRLIAAMLNTMVYNGLMTSSKVQSSLLAESAVRCLRSLYERDCRRSFCEPALWLAPAVSLHPPTAAAARAHHEVSSASSKMRDSFQAPGVGAVLTTIPHVLPFEQRVHIFREFVRTDKSRKQMGGEAIGPGPGTIEIAVRRDHVVEDGFAQLNGLGSKLKSCINVSFVNEHGLSEAGLDYGGLFKEFLTNLAKSAFDPGYGLFVQTATEEGLLFPHPAAASLGHGLQMIEFLGQIIGKALYEGILLEYSFAPLFVSKLLGRYSFLDELSTLDAELHRNLMYLKHYEGDARDLALDFTVTEELFGKHTTVELRLGGADIPVTNENKLQYVHAMADYKLNRQMRPIISAFSRGLSYLVAPSWLGLFNAKEFNQLLSGGEHDFDVEDLRANTRYTGGFTDSSRTVKLFWEVVAGLEAHERCALLKFVTSCSRAPLLGFKHLQPAFTIHKVVCDAPVWAIIGGQDVERLPSASTCYNTLKLPTYKRLGTLRDKLRYAILSNAGFELS